MFNKTTLLEKLFCEFDISNLPHGIKEDKLGDLMEKYCDTLLNSPVLLEKYKNFTLNSCDTDEYVYSLIMSKYDRNPLDIIKVTSTTDIKHRLSGENSKTDVLAKIVFSNGDFYLPISVKQTTVPKVAMAEFDAETIFKEVGITDPIVKELILKHQIDASAKNFTPQQKLQLKEGLAPFARAFVRWVVTGTPYPTNDLRFPEVLVKIRMSKNDEILDIKVYSVDEYVDTIMLDKHGNIKSGGFGTGLSWTYATGSKGRKLQFKG